MKEKLEKKLTDLQTAKEQLTANLNGTIGAIHTITELLKELTQEPKEENG